MPSVFLHVSQAPYRVSMYVFSMHTCTNACEAHSTWFNNHALRLYVHQAGHGEALSCLGCRWTVKKGRVKSALQGGMDFRKDA
ncbi:hypothetical protein Fmac_004138 [Flemingia macrophylla]|uniref:Uncharacterized protein n=1 Tax=Flemingia macrophylla TaxID=520843 RepID=A0ABD1N432_9FABA